MAKLLKQDDGEKFAIILNKKEFEAVDRYFSYTNICAIASSATKPYHPTLHQIGEDIRANRG